MSRKAVLRTLMVAFLVLCMGSAFLLPQAAQAKVTLKAISAWPMNEKAVSDDFIPFIKAVNAYMEKNYPGELEIKFMGGPEVIPTMQQPEALQAGVVQMYFGTAAYYNGIAPSANASKLTPFTSAEEMDMGIDAVFDEIHRKKLGAAYLGRLGSEHMFQLYTLKPINSLAELKGKRIRTSPMYIDFLKALEAQPISAKPGDVYQALERGVVDGTMWPLYTMRPWGWHEVLKYTVGPTFYKVIHPVLMNAAAYDALPEHLQKGLKTILREEAIKVDEKAIQQMDEERVLLKKAGLQHIDFSEADTKEYLKRAYDAGWEGQLKMEQENTLRLKKLLTK